MVRVLLAKKHRHDEYDEYNVYICNDVALVFKLAVIICELCDVIKPKTVETVLDSLILVVTLVIYLCI